MSWEDIDALPMPEPSFQMPESSFHGCRWVNGEALPLRPDLFCCQPCLSGSNYCPRHRAQVYTRSSLRPRLLKSMNAGQLCQRKQAAEVAPCPV